MFIKDMMTKNVVTVTPDTSLKEVGRLLKEKRINGVPVVDSTERIVGIITVTDILRLLEEIYQWQVLEDKITGLHVSELVGKERLNRKAASVMKKNVFTLNENSTLNDLMRLMFTKKIHTIPVTKDDKLVGIIGKRDLVYACF